MAGESMRVCAEPRGLARQSGLSFIGFLMVMALVSFFAFIGMKLFPMYQEYYSVVSVLKKVQAEPGIAQKTPAQVLQSIERYFDTSYVNNVTRQHITINRRGTYTVKAAWERRTPLFGNLSAVATFETEVELSGRDRG